ncbi:signal transduction histidine kinase [Streptomyces zagrosensis]|uniref:histidine kinase n=1 Tax=Streptomyces zagrosensis TaxID=1042984 RepID=A0A7W9Q9C6_9ACTN|nr:nitrate- and nitrite sensing domain-containing protein [Streptomyces zagrosensis]MBB5935946.1 signal transduction histidine kinase [Streptomyces zagrosensis]
MASPEDVPDTPVPSGGRLAPRNWRVRVRLNAILLIPVLVALVFGGFQVASSVQTWNEAQDAERTARLVRAAATYGQALINERDTSAVPLLTGGLSEDVKRARTVTDAAADEFDKRVDDMPGEAGLKRRLKAFRAVEPRLGSLRQNAYTVRLPGVQTEEGYVTVQHPLMEFTNELGLGTGNITSYGRTVYAISLAKAAESLQRSIGTHLLVKPGPGEADLRAQLTAVASYTYLERIALVEFESGGMEEDTAYLKAVLQKATESSAKQVADAKAKAEAKGEKYTPPPSMDAMIKAISSGAKPSELRSQGITADSWFAASTAKFDAYRAVEQRLVDKAVDEAAQISSDARRDTFVNSAIVLVALLAAFIVAGLMARSMSQSMRRLRNAAFEVAERRLPDLVDQLSRTEPGQIDTRVTPIPISTRDEIGEVARAFDQVHREAVRLAAEQALLRGNVNAIFTNLSRRNQGLIERQLTLISTLENNEADPDQLDNLFRMDHLATRMRRNGENLLVLAGEEPGRRWNQPVPLVDVLRAASSEVENYERIELTGIPESEIHGNAVTDLVHLLAELLENAATFSSPQTKVRVTATRLPDGRVMIEIHDKGIGLTAEDFADINHKLANPPTVDVAISQRMGLFVVGRLANRHGIRVQLRPSGEQAGTTSLVMLPEPITHGGGGEPPKNDFARSQPVPEQPTTQAPQALGAQHAPADSGFRDPGYESGHGAPYETTHNPSYEAGHSAAYGAGHGAPYESKHDAAQQGDAGSAAYGADSSTGHQVGYDAVRDSSYYGSGYAAPQGDGAPAPYGDQSGYDDGARYDDARYDGAGYDDRAGHQDQAGYGAQSGYDEGTEHRDGTGYEAGYGDGTGYEAAQQAPYPGVPEHTEHTGQSQRPIVGAEQNTGALPEYGGYPSDNYRNGAYPEAGYTDQSETGQQPYAVDNSPGQQGEWSSTGEYEGHFGHAPHVQTEPPLGAAEDGLERVESHRPGPSPSGIHSITDAGLPRRDTQWQEPDGAVDPAAAAVAAADRTDTADPAPEEQAEPEQQKPQHADSGWQSANDERWHRAEQLREPKAGGVTPSGLPRRVPKANLVEGAAEESQQGGPQISRAPEDIRGRLSNLRRGVQQGRNAGADNSTHDQHDQQGFGPGSTYDQER